MSLFSNAKLIELTKEVELLRTAKRRADVLDASCGVGLWDAVLFNADAMHPESKWTWSAEFRRLLGFTSETDFPNVVHSWSDRLHPEDAPPTFAAFAASLQDTSGRCSYNVEYRMKMRDGSYRWFRATGGCKLDVNGRVHACGSFSDIHDAKTAQAKVEAEAASAKQFFTTMSKALESLADGNLNATISGEVPGQYATIRENFNLAVNRICGALREVASVSTNLREGARQISSATSELSSRTEEHAASIEETVATMGEITATVERTAQGSRRAADATHSAKVDAEKSGEVVKQTVDAMSEIEASARQIGQIISVIDEIAFQTNLLALNAGVEAARAGDAGRGFAVVASEVRALAQRSADAAREIKELISQSTRHVEKGVGLVASTGATLQSIIAKAAEAANLVSEISKSAQEQSSSVSQMNQAVNQMGQVMQANAAMVEESAASSRTLSQDAERLDELVRKFDLGAGDISKNRAASSQSTAGHSGSRRARAAA